MAHYLEIREVDKALVNGVKVFSSDALKDKYVTVHQAIRTPMNSIVKHHYGVKDDEWDHDMFVMSIDDVCWLEESLVQSLSGGIDDEEEEKLKEFCGFLNKLDFSKDKAYLICWGK